ncbi:MAG: hypothetical protein ABI481_11590 [Pyrinomonadaceae bacterium]
MSEEKKAGGMSSRTATAICLLIPFVCILVAEVAGWSPLDVYFVADGIEYACLGVLAALIALILLPGLWTYNRIRFF